MDLLTDNLSGDTPDALERSDSALPAAEEALLHCFDLQELMDATGEVSGKKVSSFFDEFHSDWVMPPDLYTRISIQRRNPDSQPSRSITVPGFHAIATLIVDFQVDDAVRPLHELNVFDFVQSDQGTTLYQKAWHYIDGERLPYYVRALSPEECAALAKDAQDARAIISAFTAEVMKLGPLVEPTAEDGSRRFHIGDIVSVVMGGGYSARGVDAWYDLLGYMTGEIPQTAQLGRFADECAPWLRQQFAETLGPYYEVFGNVRDEIELVRKLLEVSEAIGTSMLKVELLDPSQHAQLDLMTELELDHGPEVSNKFIGDDLLANDQSEE